MILIYVTQCCHYSMIKVVSLPKLDSYAVAIVADALDGLPPECIVDYLQFTKVQRTRIATGELPLKTSLKYRQHQWLHFGKVQLKLGGCDQP